MIALVDCNAFFCSCERLFRPDIWYAPVGVLSNNDGCFISRTKELKAIGVKMGQPYFQVKELCEKNNVQVFSANFSLYANISQRVIEVLKEMTDVIEVYSIDEAFLEIKLASTKELEEWACHLRARVLQEIGIPVSVGIAKTKVLAKLANALAKKKDKGPTKGVCVLDSSEREEFALKRFPVSELWGVGSRSAEKLERIGLKNAWQLKNEKNHLKIQKLLTKVGRMIQDELKGISCFPIQTVVAKKKNITASRSFGTPVYDLQTLKEATANFASKACEKLRAQKSSCASVGAYFRTSPFRDGPYTEKSGLIQLENATQDTRKIIRAVWDILEREFEKGPGYAKAGIGLYDICDEDQVQLGFFDTGDSLQERLLMERVDKLNAKEGEGTLRSLACGSATQAWRMRQEKRSPRYLSGWTELARVKC